MRRMYSEKQIDSQIKEVIESGQVDNAKPIYWHGLEYFRTGTAILYGHILNNTAEEINTLAKFTAWLTDTTALKIFQCHGRVKLSGESDFRDILSIFKRANETSVNMIVSDESSGYIIKSAVDLSDYFESFNDGVNKIN